MTSELALEYACAGHEVYVVSTSPDIDKRRSLRPRDPIAGVELVPSRPRARDRARDFLRTERLGVRDAIRGLAPDVVHAHWTYEFALGAMRSGSPVVITVHDWAPAIFRHVTDPYRAMRLAMQVRVLAANQTFTAPSEYIARRVRRTYHRECQVIPNGVRLEPLGILTRPLPVTGGLRIGMLNASDGRLKNVAAGLEAFGQFRERRPGSLLRIGGPDFEPHGKWTAEVTTRGLSRQVELCGRVPSAQVPDWMAGIDVLLHPSLEESFGMVLIEAMAAGVVVVAGRQSGAVPEVVGPAGVLVDVRSPASIAEALERIAADADLLARLRADGHSRARRFDLTEVAGRYLEVLGRATLR